MLTRRNEYTKMSLQFLLAWKSETKCHWSQISHNRYSGIITMPKKAVLLYLYFINTFSTVVHDVSKNAWKLRILQQTTLINICT